MKVVKPVGTLRIYGDKEKELMFDGAVSYLAMIDAVAALARMAGEHVHFSRQPGTTKAIRSFWYSLAKRALASAACLSCGKQDMALVRVTYKNAVDHTTR